MMNGGHSDDDGTDAQTSNDAGRWRTLALSVLLLSCVALTVMGAATAQTADRYEDNDDTFNATTLDSGTYTGLTAEANERDFYEVEVDAGQELSAHISYDESVAEPTLAVFVPDDGLSGDFDSSPDLVDTATNGDGNASVGETFDTEGNYYVRVIGGDESVSYDLTIDVADNGTAGTTDQFEPDDSTDSASTLESGTYTGLTAEANQEDYFAVDVESGQELSAHIEYDQSVAEPTLDIFVPDNGLSGDFDSDPDLVETATNGDGNASVGETFGSDGTYYVRVTGGDESASYNLTVDVGENGTAGATDRFEPDDTTESASTLESGTYTGLTAEANQDDLYAVSVDSGQELSAHIAYDQTVADPTLDIYVPDNGLGGDFDSDADLVKTATSVNGNASVGETVDSAGTYYVRVTGGDESVSYDLTIDVGENGTAGAVDPFEPDNSTATASTVGSGSYDDLLVQSDGSDYFAVEVREGEEVSAHIAYDELVAKPTLAIYDGSGGQVATVDSADGNDSVGYHVDSAGTYYVGVTGGDEDVRYDLTVDVADNGTAGAVDGFEPNDALDTASTVEPGTYTGLVAENGDTDYYAVPVESGNVLSARLTFDAVEGEAGLALLDENGGELERVSADDADGEEILNETINTGGTYYVQVTGTDADTSYDLAIGAGSTGLTPAPEPAVTTTTEGSTTTEPTTTAGATDADERAETTEADDGDASTDGSGPGFGVVTMAVAVAAVALLLRRR